MIYYNKNKKMGLVRPTNGTNKGKGEKNMCYDLSKVPEINIVDAICGAGKTSAAINMIKNSTSDEKFLYITPYLTEVERIKTECKNKHFVEPKAIPTKLAGLKRLLTTGENIVSTHALFEHFDSEAIGYLQSYNYTLIMDEVADVVKPLDIAENDLTNLLANYVTVKQNGLLKWDKDNLGDYVTGRYLDYKQIIDLESAYMVGNTVILWLFPVSCFTAFKKIYLLTYMYYAQVQRYYYDSYNLKYNYLYVKGDNVNNYELTAEPQTYTTHNYKNLIHICDSEKLNGVGNGEWCLSKNWFLHLDKDGNTSAEDSNRKINLLKRNLYNYFYNIANTPSCLNLWTTFKEIQSKLKGKGYAKAFIPSNSRATNAYRGCVSLAYILNKYMKGDVKIFFTNRNIKVDEDGYAVSELLQWIFRSAVRDGKEIKLYIPSRRMRELLQAWLNNPYGINGNWDPSTIKRSKVDKN